MNVTDKLRLIQEGYSIDQINSGEAKPCYRMVEPAMDDITLFTESVRVDLDFMENMIKESAVGTVKDALKRFIAWIIEKLRQFKQFIMNLFKKRKQEVVQGKLTRVKEQIKRRQAEQLKSTAPVVHKGPEPVVVDDIPTTPISDEPPASTEPVVVEHPTEVIVSGTLERIINDPRGAIATLKELVDKFEDEVAIISDKAYKGYNENIKEGMKVGDMTKYLWKKVTGDKRAIKYSTNTTQNVVQFMLGGPKDVTVNVLTEDHINNIMDFAEDFYGLWKDMNNALKYYEDRLVELKDFSEAGFTIIRLTCDTMLTVYPNIFKVVDAHINHLANSLNLQ